MPPRGPPGAPPGPPGGFPVAPPAGGAPNAFARFGKLSVKVLRAFDLTAPGSESADPYVKLSVGSQIFQTKAREKGAGNTPEFNEQYEFNISTEKELVVEVLDRDNSGGGMDRMMAQTRVDIVPWLAKGGFEGDIALDNGKLAVVAAFSKPGVPAPPGGAVKAAPMAPSVLSGPAVAPLPPGSNAISVPGAPPMAPSEPPRDPNGAFTDKEILEAFQAFDLDHNNYVGAAEIRHVLINIGESPTDEEVDEMIKMVDKDGDGQVSFDEFYSMVTKGKQPPPGLGVGPTKAPSEAAGGAGAGAAASGAQAIQMRNQRKTALEEFARDNGIKPESVKKAYKRFQATDKDGSGQIDYSEFCEIMQVDPSPQCEKVFQLFDNDKTGRIDVREFMIALSNFSGAEKDEKLKFAFMVFDEDGNGVITRQELMKILKANHMASNEAEVARKADTVMSQGDKDGDGVISFDEFAVVSKKFPNILFPAYTLGAAKD
jgi:serine/threonine-protein phosphatase 2B regulatory subunit